MKKIYLLALATAFAVQTNAQTKPVAKTATKPNTAVKKRTVAKPGVKIAPKPIIKTKLDSASYAFGWSMANNLKSAGLASLNYDLLTKGLKDAFSAAKPALDEQTSQQAINNIFESYAKVREEKEKTKFEPQIKEGENFLAQNKLKTGIKTTASGLQYEVLNEGSGQKPKATDQVTVHYKGSLLNGTEFDSSYKRNEPTSFGLNQVIPGWTEGVQLMQEGAKYRFFIPYHLAYGARGAGQSIPPYSTLIFEVELVKVGVKAE